MSEGLVALVCTYGTDPAHHRVVRSLLEQDLPPQRILVVHNPAHRRSARDQTDADGVRILSLPRNVGYGAAMNVGLSVLLSASPPAETLMLTHDIEMRPGFLATMRETCGHSGIGVVGAQMLWGSSGKVFTLGGTRARGGSVGHLGHGSDYRARDDVLACRWVDGGAWCVRTDVFERVGLLEPRYFMYYEEPLFCLRAERAGFRIATATGAVAVQHPGGGNRVAAYAYLTARNGLDFAREASGLRGVAYTALERVRSVSRQLRATRHADAELQAEARLNAQGSVLGIRDYFANRWGGPPALRGVSDISGT